MIRTTLNPNGTWSTVVDDKPRSAAGPVPVRYELVEKQPRRRSTDHRNGGGFGPALTADVDQIRAERADEDAPVSPPCLCPSWVEWCDCAADFTDPTKP